MNTFKTKILASLLSVWFAVANAQEKELPDWDTTIDYIDEIVKSTIDYAVFYPDPGDFEWRVVDGRQVRLGFNGDEIAFSERISKTGVSGYIDIGIIYSDIDWSKMINITFEDTSLTSSPVKWLVINFPENSLKFTGYSTEDTQGSPYEKDYSLSGKIKSHFRVNIPYRNIEGEQKRLINAVKHLSNLAKKQKSIKKAYDPFAE